MPNGLSRPPAIQAGTGKTGLSTSQSGSWWTALKDWWNSTPGSELPHRQFSGNSVPLSVPVTTQKTGTVYVPGTLIRTVFPPRLTWGKKLSSNLSQVMKDQEETHAGDVLQIEYRMKVPVFKDWQFDQAVQEWRKDDRFELLWAGVWDEDDKIIVQARVLHEQSPVIIIVGLIAAVVVGISLFLTVREVRRVFRSDADLGEPSGLTHDLIWAAAFGLGALIVIPRIFKKKG